MLREVLIAFIVAAVGVGGYYIYQFVKSLMEIGTALDDFKYKYKG